MYAYAVFTCASLKFLMLNIDSGANISEATPTSVDKIGVFVIAHSRIACGPPSTLDVTRYKSKILYNSLT